MAVGLILSSSNFASGSLADAPWNTSTKDIAFFTGGVYGTASLNSSLSSPITSSGDYSRLFVHQNDGTNRPYGFYLVSSSVDSGVYSGPYSVSKAYSVRAWIRKESGGNVRDSIIGIILRNKFDGTTQTISDSAENYNIVPGGYTLQYSSRAAGTAPGDGSAYLFLQIRDPYSSPLSFGQTTIRCSGSYALDTWHRVRIDLIPLFGVGDQINVYTSSAGDVASGNEVWEEVASKFVNNTDSGFVDPADSDAAMGFYAASQANNGQDAFIDQFEILVEDL